MENRRRNSLERYQPRGTSDENTDMHNSLLENFSGLSMSDNNYENEPIRSKGARRGVNSHLYAKAGHSNRGRGGRGNNRGGRGRGRGSNPRHHTNINEQNGGYNDDYSNKPQSHNTNHNNHEQNNSSWGQSSNSGNESMTFQAPDPVFKRQQYNNKSSMHQFERNYKPHKKNTETFKPSHKPAEMRILCAPESWTKYSREIMSRDVLIINRLFCEPTDLTLYEKLLNEIKTCGVDQEDLWKLWHGDSHVIADDKLKWKEACPTFHMVLHKIQEYFEMDIKATRLNWYRDSKEWKPFHHDAAALKADKAKTQNLTVAVSFGAERDAAFEHATTKTVISMPQPNGTIYVFAKDVNIIWRHGILQVPPDMCHEQGRISIIAWGWSKQTPI